MPNSTPSALVVGGGIAGLVAARDLALAGLRVSLVEREDTLGGRLSCVELAGLPVELGAESFATRGGSVRELCEELGLTDEIVAPHRSSAWVVGAQSMHTLPESGALGIPSKPLGRATRRALGLPAALRVAVEPWLPRTAFGPDASLAEVARTRIGSRAVARLVTPVTEGVYSAAPETLPFAGQTELAAAYAKQGSLVRAARSVRASRLAAGGAVATLTGGLSRVIKRLEAELQDLGVTVYTNAAVTGIVRGDEDDATASTGNWQVSWAGQMHHADAVVLAIAPGEIAKLMHQPEFVAPSAIAVETVALVVDAPELDRFPRGTGALIRPGHPTIAAKALTHATAKWPWLKAAAPAGRHVLRLSYGRRGEAPPTAQLSDAEAAELAMRDAAVVLGASLPPAALVAHARARWSIPDRASLPPLSPGLVCVGEAFAGTGLASVVPHAREAVASLRFSLSPTLLGN